MMRNRVMALLTFFGVVSMTAAGPVQAQVNDTVQWGVTISSGMPPPPVLYERTPLPRPQFAWVNGFWYWNGGAYSWVPGHWEPARAGYLYSQPAWQQDLGGWNAQPGRWRQGGRYLHRDHERDEDDGGRGGDHERGHGRGHGHGHEHGRDH